MVTGINMKAAPSEVLLRSAVIDEDIALAGDMRIGRDEDCEIQIDDIHVSRYHARITVADDLILLEDLGSTNGTFVNGNRIQGQQQVSVGDELRFHHCLFRLVSKQSTNLDRTVFDWPVNMPIEAPSELPKLADSIPPPVAASPLLNVDLAPEEDSGLSQGVELESPVESEAGQSYDQVQRDRKSAIERQLGKELRETRGFLERVQSLPIGSWLVLNDQGADACVLCKLAVRSVDGNRLRFVADNGLYIFDKDSRELAEELHYDRAHVLDKGPLLARIAVLVTGAMGRARRGWESDNKVG